MDENNVKADVWYDIIKDQLNKTSDSLKLVMKIQEAMKNYLKTISESEDFEIEYNAIGTATLTCKEDLFDLEQIGGFCDIFNLDIIVTSRLVVENFIKDTTEVKNSYYLQVKSLMKSNEEDSG